MAFSASQGQGAMEYLMTYAWAILIVMVVGLAMYQLGLFNPGSNVPTYTGWETLQPAFGTIVYYQNGTFRTVLINQEGVPVRVNDVTITDVFTGSPCSGTTVKGMPMPGEVLVDKGEGFLVSAQNCGGPKTKDEPYKLHFSVSYTALIDQRSIDHVQEGIIEGSVE